MTGGGRGGGGIFSLHEFFRPSACAGIFLQNFTGIFSASLFERFFYLSMMAS